MLVALWIAFARGPADADGSSRLRRGGAVAFVAFGKVLSPQFLIWLVPLVPLVRGRRGLAATALLLAALVLTQVWFPYRYWDLALRVRPLASWLVLVRDLVLVALLVVARQLTSTRTGSQRVARPSASHSTSAPSIRTSPCAGSNRTGSPVRIRGSRARR